MQVSIRIIDSPQEGHSRELGKIEAEGNPHVIQAIVKAGMQGAADKHLHNAEFKADSSIFGGYYRDASGRCIVAV